MESEKMIHKQRSPRKELNLPVGAEKTREEIRKKNKGEVKVWKAGKREKRTKQRKQNRKVEERKKICCRPSAYLLCQKKKKYKKEKKLLTNKNHAQSANKK